MRPGLSGLNPIESVGKDDHRDYRRIEYNLQVAPGQTRKLKLVLYTPVLSSFFRKTIGVDNLFLIGHKVIRHNPRNLDRLTIFRAWLEARFVSGLF